MGITEGQPLLIYGDDMERVPDLHFLGVQNTTIVKKMQQRLNFLRVLRSNNLPQKLLVAFHPYSIVSILTDYIYGLPIAQEQRGRLSKVSLIWPRKSSLSLCLPSINCIELVDSVRCKKIIKDPSHPI